MRRIFARLLILALVWVLSACGMVAQPVWEQAETATAEAATRAANATAIALGLPSPTPVTPTATPAPTETATPTPAPSPTPIPTQEPPTATPTLAPTSTPMSAGQSGGIALPAGFSDAVAGGDAAAGQTVFNTPHNMPNGQSWACSQCHSVTPDEARLIGPGLWNVSVRGATRVPGQYALTYIYTSITHPSEFHVVGNPEYPVNLMPEGYADVLAPEELVNLVAYLYSLK